MEKQLKEIDVWKRLRINLNNSYGFNPNWNKAVELFNKRIQTKYFNPINDLIEGNPQKKENLRKGEGFSIVTIHCAIIETFAAFKQGLIYNHDKPEIGGISFEYKDSRDLFVTFLNSASIFKGIFYNIDKEGKQQNGAFSGRKFYSQVRCGLMHEARTRGDWHINATSNDDPKDKRFLKQTKKGNIIYRTLLHYALIDYFEQYKTDLKNKDGQFNDLRRKFARKLDDLYDIKDHYEWWNE